VTGIEEVVAIVELIPTRSEWGLLIFLLLVLKLGLIFLFKFEHAKR